MRLYLEDLRQALKSKKYNLQNVKCNNKKRTFSACLSAKGSCVQIPTLTRNVRMCRKMTSTRNVLFWVTTQRIPVLSYRRFGTTYRYHLHGARIFYRVKSLFLFGFLTIEDETERLSRNVGKKLPPLAV
jgi:hypothetical protein